jgi:hypothetical protein
MEDNSEENVQSKFDFAKDKLDETVEWISEMYTKHPKENGMTGLQHFLFAMRLSGMTMLSGLLMFVHAIAPWWFTTTGGDLLLYAGETLNNSREHHTHVNTPTPGESQEPIVMEELNNDVENEWEEDDE